MKSHPVAIYVAKYFILSLYIILPFLAFFLGMEYQKRVTSSTGQQTENVRLMH